ncbi:SWIM zinc finger family protein [Gordonia sp. ABSL1-1]|uniref:SWIM zinc finger family protein n=1 Tax=Gordonia sp. ABSL1-1 TaxID=3053923 RepID=UPI002572CF27|nr:SWIM zinc finger family protein [Gordonia sp. ABSL1-1]MDL9935642.1 SWIM zinc finger family protein [Gordonia sp. ABSL1-1]
MSRGTVPVRGYALTRWGRAFVDVVEGRTDGNSPTVADSRHITKARRYFRDRHVRRLSLGPGRVSASVDGSQLDPFDVILTMRVVDAGTVTQLLRAQGAVDDLMSLTRGEQPATLGSLILPTETADIASDCTCPDGAVRCIHALAVAYEVAAEIDRSPLTLLSVMGTDLKSLLDAAGDRTPRPTTEADADDGQTPVTDDFFGGAMILPPLPTPSRMNPLTDLDGTALRAALRATGVTPADMAETIDELGDLYDRLVEVPTDV